MLKAASFNPSNPLVQNFTNTSGTPGNATINTPRGRVGVAAAASTVVVTNSLVSATSTILVQMVVQEATLTSVAHVTPAAGSFTITFNAAATGATAVADFIVIN